MSNHINIWLLPILYLILTANLLICIFYYYLIPERYIAGPEASVAELTDFICAAQMAKAEDIFFQEPDEKVFTTLENLLVHVCIYVF